MSSPPTLPHKHTARRPSQPEAAGPWSSEKPSKEPTWSHQGPGPTAPFSLPLPPSRAPTASFDRGTRVLPSPARSPAPASSSSASGNRPARPPAVLSPPTSAPASGSAPSRASHSRDNSGSDLTPARADLASHRHGGTGTPRPSAGSGFRSVLAPPRPASAAAGAPVPLPIPVPSNSNANSSLAPANLSPSARPRYPLYTERSASPAQDPGSDHDNPSEAVSAASYPSMFQIQLTGGSGGESSRGPRRPPYPAYITEEDAIDNARGQKRKGSYTYATPEDRHGKMRRSSDRPSQAGSPTYSASLSQSPLPPRSDPMASMVTITCYHPTVAQKSYGAEKRYFSPPPFVSIRGPLQNAPSQALEMNVVTGREGGGIGDVESAQAQFLDGSLMATFRTLHVGGLSNRKRCQLRLSLSDASTADSPETVEALANRPFSAPQNAFYALPSNIPAGARKWATFLSTPIAILSKPAKHMKSHDPSSITFGSTVSLYHRLNSQTARTKYVHINAGRRMLETSGASWTPLVVERVDTPAGPGRPGGLTLPFTAPSFEDGFGSLPPVQAAEGSRPTPRIAPLPPIMDVRRLEVLAPLTFNSTVTLYDPQTGVRSPPLIIKKVVNGHIKPDEPAFGDPLDPLNHVGASSTLTPLEPVGQLQKVAFMRPSQPHPRGRGPPGLEPNMYWGTPPDSDEMMFGTPIQSGRPARAYRPRSRRIAAAMDALPQPEDPEEGLEELDDAVVWTIVSVTNFKYSYFASDPNRTISPTAASTAPTPFPALRQEPFYRPQTRTLQMVVDDFDPSLDIYVDKFGPLNVSVVRQGSTDSQGRKLYDPRTWFEAKRPPADQPAAEFAIGGGSLPDRGATPVSPTSSPEGRAGPSKTGPKPLRAKIPPALDVAKPQTVLQVELPHIMDIVHACFRNDPSSTGTVQTDLPIIFMRTVDGTGFHSGKSIVVENILGDHYSKNDRAGWTVRVVSR